MGLLSQARPLPNATTFAATLFARTHLGNDIDNDGKAFNQA